LPNILDELVTALSAAKGQSAVSPFPQETSDSLIHGIRGLRGGVNIEEVVREYGVLVDILLDELAVTGGTLDTREWQLAMHCIVETIASYARRRDEELRRQTARHVAFIAPSCAIRWARWIRRSRHSASPRPTRVYTDCWTEPPSPPRALGRCPHRGPRGEQHRPARAVRSGGAPVPSRRGCTGGW
jgi:hypothetical protein